MQVLFTTGKKLQPAIKALEKEFKLVITKINKLENPVVFAAYTKSFHYRDGSQETLVPGLFYYHIMGHKENLLKFANKFGLIPDGHSIDDLQVTAYN